MSIETYNALAKQLGVNPMPEPEPLNDEEKEIRERLIERIDDFLNQEVEASTK